MNRLKLIPEGIKTDEQVLLLRNILPTGYFAANIANVQQGDDVAVFGACPVGYFPVMSFLFKRSCMSFLS